MSQQSEFGIHNSKSIPFKVSSLEETCEGLKPWYALANPVVRIEGKVCAIQDEGGFATLTFVDDSNIPILLYVTEKIAPYESLSAAVALPSSVYIEGEPYRHSDGTTGICLTFMSIMPNDSVPSSIGSA